MRNTQRARHNTAWCLLALVFACAWMFETAGIRAENRGIPSIVFRFQETQIGGRCALHVNETFRVQKTQTEVRVPTHWGGAAHLEDQTQNLRVDSPGATLSDDVAGAGKKLLHAKDGGRVDLSYDVVSQQTEWFSHPQEHMAVINADYFLFNPENALVYPAMADQTSVDVTFDWRELPRNIPIVSSFGSIQSGAPNRVIHVRAPWIRIADGLLAGGNFRIVQSKVNDSTVVLAIRGTWKFKDDDALGRIRGIVDAENRFWQSSAMPYFLVTLAPFDDRSGSNDGSGFTNAFMLFLSHEDSMDDDRMQLMAHEMFHHWNPMSMGSRSADEVAQWFSEGFTVYYAGIVPLRNGLTGYQQYLDYLNRWLRRYELSPLRKLTATDWKSISHSSGPGYELSYERGAAMALWADAAIRTRSQGSRSLDNVMLDLVRQTEAQNAVPEFTEERILAAFSPYLSTDEMQQLRRMALDGSDVPLPDKLGECALRQSVTRAVVDPGFDTKASMQSKRVTGVVTDGPAYRAGVRDGQELFRLSVYNDDPSKDALLGVVVDGQRKMITFSTSKLATIDEYRAIEGKHPAGKCTPF